jgi:DNA-binding response OmpR family regulator
MGNDRSPLRPVGKGLIPRPLSALKVPERPSAKKPAVSAVPAARPEPQRRNQPPPAPALEPTLLLVGADDKFAPALRIALARHRMYVETADLADVAETVVVTAPDLVLLSGEAARDGGATVLEKLAGSPATSVVPVAILDDNTALDVRLRAFRHGAVAVIQRSASIDAIANEVARLAREIPERGGEALGVVGEATLSEFVNALGKELRSGILSLKSEGEAPVRLVLGGGRPLAELIDEFVKRASGHVVKAEPLEYEFDGRASGTIQLLGAETETAPGTIGGLRVALADDDPARADVIAQELRARGATVVVVDLEPTELQFSRLRQIDPEVLLIGEEHVQGAGYSLIRKMRRDTRLRWASLLVVRWDEVWSERVAVPAIDRLTGALRALTEGDRGLRERVDTAAPFDTRLEITGPARCLRALAASSRSLRVTVFNPRVRVTVDLSEGLVAGASAESADESAPSSEPWDGTHALAALLVLSSGRVHVEPVQQPATTNVMATIDVALSLADQEAPPIAPSIPAASGSSFPPPSDQAPTVRVGAAPMIPVGVPKSEAVTTRDLPRVPAPPPAAPVSATSPFVQVSVTPPGAYPLVPPPPPPSNGPPAFRPIQPTLPGGIEAPPPPPASLPPVSAAPPSAPPAPLTYPPSSSAISSPTAFTRATNDLVDAAKQAAGVGRKGVSPMLAIVLVSLAALQGALIAVGHWWVTKPSDEATGSEMASTSEAALAAGLRGAASGGGDACPPEGAVTPRPGRDPGGRTSRGRRRVGRACAKL